MLFVFSGTSVGGQSSYCWPSIAVLETRLFSNKIACRHFIAPVLWPLNDPDPNPVYYKVCCMLHEHVYCTLILDVDDLKQYLLAAWSGLEQRWCYCRGNQPVAWTAGRLCESWRATLWTFVLSLWLLFFLLLGHCLILLFDFAETLCLAHTQPVACFTGYGYNTKPGLICSREKVSFRCCRLTTLFLC